MPSTLRRQTGQYMKVPVDVVVRAVVVGSVDAIAPVAARSPIAVVLVVVVPIGAAAAVTAVVVSPEAAGLVSAVATATATVIVVSNPASVVAAKAYVIILSHDGIVRCGIGARVSSASSITAAAVDMSVILVACASVVAIGVASPIMSIVRVYSRAGAAVEVVDDAAAHILSIR